jgi:WD40 repeat protein
MKTGAFLIGILSFSLAACTSTTLKTVAPKTPLWTAFPSSPNPYYINSVASSADGSRVVGGTFFHAYSASESRGPATTASQASGSTGTFGTYCYDASGALLWKDEFTGYEGVYWVDLARSGAYAASGGWYSNNPYNGFVRAYAVSGGSKLLDYRTAKRVNQVVLSADGSWLVSAAETVVLFQLVNGAYQKSAEFTPTTPNDTIESIAMSADGQTIVCSDYAGSLYLLANQQGGGLAVKQQWAMPAGGYSHSVRITSDGTAFAAGGASGFVYYFNVASFVASGQPTITYQMASKGSVYGVAVADDGSAFVGISNLTAGSDVGGLVCYLQIAGSQATLKWQYTTARNPNCASLNLAGGMLAVADGHPDNSPGDFYLLNTADGTLRWQYTTGNMSWPITIAANGTAVVAGSDDSHIYYFTP